MKVFLKNAITKKILIVFVTIIMVSNFIMPNYVSAASANEQSAGEKLVSGFFYLLGYIGDEAIKIMQEIMLGYKNIGNDTTGFKISYAPGTIFANEVEALDINFLEPMETEVVGYSNVHITNTDSITNYDEIIGRMQQQEEWNTTKDFFGDEIDQFWKDTLRARGYYDNSSITMAFKGNPDDFLGELTLGDRALAWIESLGQGTTYSTRANVWINGNTMHLLIARIYVPTLSAAISPRKIIWAEFSTQLTADEVKNINSAVNQTANNTTVDTIEKKSIAAELQNNIATWYLALRTIALVGLLSVLVYLGIRIILSSTSAQDKAKYKNMLKDWIVAICILFLLHYIMAFMLDITDRLGDIIKNNIIEYDSSGRIYDTLMSDIRNSFSADFDNVWIEAPGRVVMYLALVILTGVFTFQYLKRVVFMAFLTMVAPLIALTYPIDKVKDGKAQAFSYWLKEYIFNCLIQPVHLLLYTVLISNAIDFATDNVLYAIVALAFLVPAEKFVKDMFGMKSNSPTGQLGAAAGGAMVMSMLNKIKAKPPKDDAGSGKASNPNGVRTATNRTASAGGTGANASGAGANAGGTDANTSGAGASAGGAGANASGAGANTAGPSASAAGASTGAAVATPSNSSNSRPGVGAGLKRAGRNLGIKGVDLVKSAGIGALKKAPGAVLGATVGLAATVASGGENAISFIGGGAAAGSALTSNIVGGMGKLGKDTYSEYQKGKFGLEEYQNKKFDKEFYKSDGYRMISEDNTIKQMFNGNEKDVKKATQAFLDAGITDATKIREALQYGISGETYKEYADVGVASAKDIAKLDKSITPTVYKDLKSAGIDSSEKMNKVMSSNAFKNKSGSLLSPDELRYRKQIAEVARDRGLKGQSFINYARTFGMDKDDAKELQKNLKEYLLL